ncbi:NB-ARC domain-containing protein,Caspase domain-containing protein [Nostoc sp. FACHB-152]|uniref:caspase family protein n=1 Tax=Nostoc sp. FACHB-152 TaxID=2692837 RepID=UPI001681F9C9|nr:caspase family protein [Nostoc sp. FACHB-152]MBD2446388.1 NB-ARC domain-containing protein,Caspase domain-containing protein [Nostoc sp. FACHB-152]
MQLRAEPKRTYGLVVGIERYHEAGWNVPGGGQAEDALRFARWLRACGVPKENIRLCLSSLAENEHLVGECVLTVESATEQNLYDIVTNFLSLQSGDLLYIFWAGHGLISAERERRLICADATKQSWLNLDLNSLLLLLGSDRFGIRHHVCIIDACANYFLETQGRPTNLGGRIFSSGKPRTDSQQFVLLATREGETAKVNAAEKTGYFSQAVHEALAQVTESFPPDMVAVAEQVKQRFQSLDKRQLPTYFYYRSWDGDQEKYHYNPFDIRHNIQQSNAIKFVGRDEKLAQLHQLLKENDVVVISDVTGLGGVGKTELAIQYSWQYLEDYPGGCCWLNPQGTELGTQLVEFGMVNFPNFYPPQELSMNGKVGYCWRNWQAGKVLLVFDDVKDWKQIKDYLPAKGSRFKVLITTRQNTGLTYPSLPLGELSADAALELLTQLLGRDRVEGELEFAQKLCQFVGYIPIGLYQVAAYSREPGRVLC